MVQSFRHLSMAAMPALCYQDRSDTKLQRHCSLQRGENRPQPLTFHLQVPTSLIELVGVHGISAYLPAELDARRDLPVVVGDVFAALLAEPTLRHAWVRFDRYRRSY